MEDQRSMDKRTMYVYAVLLIATIGVTLIGTFYDAIADVIISIPVIFLIIMTMAHDKKIVHIPPLLVIMVVVILYISLAGKVFDAGGLFSWLLNFLVGIMIGIAGLILVYALIGQLPGFEKEKPSLISLMVFLFSIAIYTLWGMVEYMIVDVGDIEHAMRRMAAVFVGSLFIAIFFYIGRSSRFFNETVGKFLRGNSERMGIGPEPTPAEKIMKIIGMGETETVEFKSTLRTNLVTGEKDKRMEKSVLKTVVAFLNTEGGTLLIGVADDGRITGIDEESFESRDKMNLHFTHLLSDQIGKEFLPFIDFIVVNFENVAVMRVDCTAVTRPVFLKENKTEQYFVRSGPSSVELSGMDLLVYVKDRESGGKRKEI